MTAQNAGNDVVDEGDIITVGGYTALPGPTPTPPPSNDPPPSISSDPANVEDDAPRMLGVSASENPIYTGDEGDSDSEDTSTVSPPAFSLKVVEVTPGFQYRQAEQAFEMSSGRGGNQRRLGVKPGIPGAKKRFVPLGEY